MKLSWIPGLLLVGACMGDVDMSEQEQDEMVAPASALEGLHHHPDRGGGCGHRDDAHDRDHYQHHDHDHGQRGLCEVLARGASRISDLQADSIGDNAHNGLVDSDPDDSGWDYTLPATATAHTSHVSPTNLFGATALGPWAAIRAGASGDRSLTTLLDTAKGMKANPAVDSGPDFVFGVLLAELTGNHSFAVMARQHYDAKLAIRGGAAGLGTLIRDSRHAGNNDGLIPYDLGWMTLGAAALDTAFPHAGYDADADTYAQIALDDLTAATPRFDLHDAHERYYVTGLSWSLVIASWLGDRDTFLEARTLLLDAQRPDGAWGTNADHPAPDLQSTAHAIQTLSLSGHLRGQARTAARRASRWLIGQQASSGGWADATGVELPLADAEILLGLFLSQTEIGRDDGLDAALEPLAPAPAGALDPAAPSD